MGKGLVERLQKEFELSVEWLGIEIHPETPAGGMLLADLFPRADRSAMMKNLRTMGAPYGIIFCDRDRISNSRPALQAAEFSRDHNAFEAFHGALLQAYFGAGLDIGDREVLAQLAGETGLDAAGMLRALEAGTYLPRLREMQDEASRRGVTGVPTFILNDKKTIVGAQSLDVFRSTLRSLL